MSERSEFHFQGKKYPTTPINPPQPAALGQIKTANATSQAGAQSTRTQGHTPEPRHRYQKRTQAYRHHLATAWSATARPSGGGRRGPPWRPTNAGHDGDGRH